MDLQGGLSEDQILDKDHEGMECEMIQKGEESLFKKKRRKIILESWVSNANIQADYKDCISCEAKTPMSISRTYAVYKH